MVRALREPVWVMRFGAPPPPGTVIPRSAYTAPQSGTGEIFVHYDGFERRVRR